MDRWYDDPVISARRAWLMAGAAVAEPVTIVSRGSKQRLSAGERLGLVGGRHVRSLGMHLAPLCRGSRISLLAAPAASDDEVAKLAIEVASGCRVVLVCWGRCLSWMPGLGASARRLGRSVALVTEPGQEDRCVGVPVFETGAWSIQLGPDGKTPTAYGYSAWAGAIWRWLG